MKDDNKPPTNKNVVGIQNFMQSLVHPLKAEVETIRQLILSADPAITEGLKWNAPSFRVRDYFATIHLRNQNAVQVILHLDAKARPDIVKRISVADPLNMLEWHGKDRASLTFANAKDSKAKNKAFQQIIRQWITYLTEKDKRDDGNASGCSRHVTIGRRYSSHYSAK